MNMTEHFFVALLLLVNLRLFASSRMGSLIRGAAAQSFLIVCLSALLRDGEITAEAWIFLIVSGLVKCFVLPLLMFRALRTAGIRRDIEPFVGYRVSLFFGLGAAAFSFWGVVQLPLPVGVNPTAIAATLLSMITGLFLIVARRKAISQAIGYLVMENGIFALGPSLAVHNPLIVEAGVLLDVFVGVFVMSVIILHIREEFKHIDIDRLSELKD